MACYFYVKGRGCLYHKTRIPVNNFVSDLAFIYNLLDSAHFAGFKTHLDAVRVVGGTGKDLLHDSSRPLPCPLILFLDDVYLKPGFYVFSVLAVHTSLFSLTTISAPFSSHSARVSCACLALAGVSLDNKLLISTSRFVS